MEIVYKSNLDYVQNYIDSLNTNRIPSRIQNVGEIIQIYFENQKFFELEVCKVRNIVKIDNFGSYRIQCIEIELHIPKIMNMSTNDWEIYFRKHVKGKSY